MHPDEKDAVHILGSIYYRIEKNEKIICTIFCVDNVMVFNTRFILIGWNVFLQKENAPPFPFSAINNIKKQLSIIGEC